MKSVLYFFPDNIGQPDAGNKTRAIELLTYFKDRKISVDFATLKSERRNAYNEADSLKFINENGLADNVFLLPRKPLATNSVVYFLRYKLWDLLYYLFAFSLKSSIPTFLTITLKRAFEKLLANKHYDYIIISYVQCADLIKNKKLCACACCIIDTHDFITAQFKDKLNFKLGATFEDEISRLNLFDQIWAISADEQFVFSQFCKPPVKLIPMSLKSSIMAEKQFEEADYDIIYVASDNIHNRRSANWFFKEVYPLLPSGLKICIIGKINNHITTDDSITRVGYAKDLSPYYKSAKISICPMLSGTGVKVKVIEALSFGLPVVCTERGIDGLPNKSNNGCLVSNNAVEFGNNIMLLLNDNAIYQETHKAAIQTFRTSFSDIAVHSSLDSAFNIN